MWGWYDSKKKEWTWGVDIFLVGAVILVVAVVYILVIGRRLIPAAPCAPPIEPP